MGFVVHKLTCPFFPVRKAYTCSFFCVLHSWWSFFFLFISSCLFRGSGGAISHIPHLTYMVGTYHSLPSVPVILSELIPSVVFNLLLNQTLFTFPLGHICEYS